MWFLTLYDTDLIELISGCLVPVATGPVPFCTGRFRDILVGAGADRNRGEIARNAVYTFSKEHRYVFWF